MFRECKLKTDDMQSANNNDINDINYDSDGNIDIEAVR